MIESIKDLFPPDLVEVLKKYPSELSMNELLVRYKPVYNGFLIADLETQISRKQNDFETALQSMIGCLKCQGNCEYNMFFAISQDGFDLYKIPVFTYGTCPGVVVRKQAIISQQKGNLMRLEKEKPRELWAALIEQGKTQVQNNVVNLNDRRRNYEE